MSFPVFSAAFSALYDLPSPDSNGSLRDYLRAGGGSGDEAGVVDNILVGALLEKLGFPREQQNYNVQKGENRPDFSVRDPDAGLCFLVEDKATALGLTLERDTPRSHLGQLRRYARAGGATLGLLTNGRRWTGWRFDGETAEPILLFDFDALAPDTDSLRLLFDRFSRAAFTDPLRIENELAVDEAAWRARAKPVGSAHPENQGQLVASLGDLIKNLATEAERLLNERLARFAEYETRITRIDDDPQPRRADLAFEESRKAVLDELGRLSATLGLVNGARTQIEALLSRIEREPSVDDSPSTLLQSVLAIVNDVRAQRQLRAWKNLDDVFTLRDRIAAHAETVLQFHQRRSALTNAYRTALGVGEDYRVWTNLVRETMLGGLSESERRKEFALQAAYVVAIRLLLIRVCEDKGIFRHRFLTDGGLQAWRANIERYYQFTNGNPYDELLGIAYKNAQNLYAHFFTGRELFNWFTLDRRGFVLALAKLNDFDFADVDADIIGTVYETYLSRKERKKRGQYYTPREVVEYLLDGVGYSGTAIVGDGKRLIDPACGSGSFLVTAANRLVATYARLVETDPAQVLEKVRASLFGFDLNPFACYLAEVNLLIQLLPLVKRATDRAGGRPPRLERFHIYNVDALALPNPTYFSAQAGSTLMAEERDEVERIKGRAPGPTPETNYASGFAFVVGNPPYGATLTDEYKTNLKLDYADVFHGKPDTYVFFFRLGVRLLAAGGRLGFITPNTFLMGTNTDFLRRYLLGTCRIEEIVDLPQGIWDDATVDCVLTLLRRDESEPARRSQTVRVHLLGLKDELTELLAQTWKETLVHDQAKWLDAIENGYEFAIRRDALLEKIETACVVQRTTGPEILRLGDVTESTQGIIPYKTREDGQANLYIRTQSDPITQNQPWKPLLDTNSRVSRYGLRWGKERRFLKYGNWLWCDREPKYFDRPKILLIRFRNKSLDRRLVGTLDETGFYNRENFNNIIELDDSGFDLKYVLALFNSSVLNFWYARRNDQVTVNPAQFRELPIATADSETQGRIVGLVDALLDANRRLNERRDAGWTISARGGRTKVDAPVGELIATLRRDDPAFSTLSLFDAEAVGLVRVADGCSPETTLSTNVFVPARFPETLVLRNKTLWLEISDDDLRALLLRLLKSGTHAGLPYGDVRQTVRVPAGPGDMRRLAEFEARETAAVEALLADAARLDKEIDREVLALYGIDDPADIVRILNSAPPDDSEEIDEPETPTD